MQPSYLHRTDSPEKTTTGTASPTTLLSSIRKTRCITNTLARRSMLRARERQRSSTCGAGGGCDEDTDSKVLRWCKAPGFESPELSLRNVTGFALAVWIQIPHIRCECNGGPVICGMSPSLANVTSRTFLRGTASTPPRRQRPARKAVVTFLTLTFPTLHPRLPEPPFERQFEWPMSTRTGA